MLLAISLGSLAVSLGPLEVRSISGQVTTQVKDRPMCHLNIIFLDAEFVVCNKGAVFMVRCVHTYMHTDAAPIQHISLGLTRVGLNNC